MDINYIIVIVYFVLLLLWCVALLTGGNKYKAFIDALDEKEHSLREFYVIGYSMLDWIKYSYTSEYDRKRLNQSKIVYGEKFGLFYYRVNMAQKVTYAYTALMLGILVGPFMGDVVFTVVGVFAAVVAYWYVDMKITDVIEAREESINKTFPDMLSKMALLVNAGMILKEAWEEIAVSGEGVMYDEMRNAIDEMNNGVSELEAYVRFGNRCGVVEVKKFTSMLSQNITKGNSELVNFLRAESVASWERKKHLVKRLGEKASSKLMIPIAMILIGILILILVPMVSNLGI